MIDLINGYPQEAGQIRKFTTGATRDGDNNKLDFEGFLAPIVLIRYAEYLHKHRFQSDGQMRGSDNWQKGMPRDVYMKSLVRHTIHAWGTHRGFPIYDDKSQLVDLEEALCAVIFNAAGYLFELLKAHV